MRYDGPVKLDTDKAHKTSPVPGALRHAVEVVRYSSS
jgi:hypothetical protein